MFPGTIHSVGLPFNKIHDLAQEYQNSHTPSFEPNNSVKVFIKDPASQYEMTHLHSSHLCLHSAWLLSEDFIASFDFYSHCDAVLPPGLLDYLMLNSKTDFAAI